MAIFEIPITNDKPSFTFKVDLDESEYTFQFRWNGRMDSWIIDLYDFEGELLVSGEPFYTETILFRNIDKPKMPKGVLYAVNNKTEYVNSDRFTIGVDVKLYYVEPE